MREIAGSADIETARRSHQTKAVRSVQLDLNVDAGRQFELHQGIDGLIRRIQDVHQSLVRADLELIARVLVAVRRNQHRKALHLDRQRHGAFDGRTGSLRCVNDLAGRLVDQTMIESLQPDPNILISHMFNSFN